MVQHVKEGEKILNHGNLDDFGKLLNSAWIIKKKLSKSISNTKLDSLYNYALQKGAVGGKLLGAGGGGFFLFYIKKEHKKKFIQGSNKIIDVPFKFTDKGSEIIYKDLKR